MKALTPSQPSDTPPVTDTSTTLIWEGPLHRGAAVIPNPRVDMVLEPEDRLLCFGRLEEMRSMIPARRKRVRKVKRLPENPIHDQE